MVCFFLIRKKLQQKYIKRIKGFIQQPKNKFPIFILLMKDIKNYLYSFDFFFSQTAI